nr:MAG TPA: hypothetical protein [Caudoviricetes sp.]
MCWTEIRDNINVQIANKDFKVYKIVLDANKQSCKSIVKGFNYTVNTLYSIPTIESEVIDPYYGKIKIEKAYHSYTGIHFICDSSYSIHSGATRCKDLLFGKRGVCIPIENDGYIATFIIPKGSTYIINTKGEIISDKIIYTGRYIKL